MAGKRTGKQARPGREDLSNPTRWRLQHGGLSEPVREADPETGSPMQHRRAVDTLGLMLANGTITQEMHDAGAAFRRQFRIASLDPLRGVDLLRVRSGTGDPLGERQFAVRGEVAGAMEVLGGFGSAGASCGWHVVGLECSITEWARGQGWGGRPVGHAQAQGGMLVVALGVLAGHYGLARRLGAA
jgi:hypothetical protein